ncbi:MAG: hypothetical protein KBD53_05845 [Candidatus Omnitrophica bacterium]|nr:hypothetical protein [Candidatus Omnitrophota bacterium]
MLHLNLFAISGLLIVITYMPLFLIINLNNDSKITRIYSLHVLCVAIWGMGAFLLGINKDPLESMKLWKFAYSGVLFIPIFFQHTVFLIRNSKNSYYLLFIYFQGLFFLFSIYNNKFFKVIGINFDNIYYFSTNNYYLFSFIIWIFITLISHIQLYFHYKNYYKNSKIIRNKELLFLLCAFLGFAGGTLNFLPGFGMKIYPFGNLFVAIHFIVVGYAILKHQFFDINIVIKRTLAYSSLITVTSVLYLTSIFITERFLQYILNYQSLQVSISLAFFLGIIFMPFRDNLQNVIDKLFFKKAPDDIFFENKQLRQEVAETEKYKTLATLASGIAHEIRNPLTVIKTFHEYLPHRHQDQDFIQKYSKLANKEIERVEDLLTQLMEYSKPNPPKFTNVQLKKMLYHTIDVLNHHFLNHHIECQRNINIDHDFSMQLDPNQIHQALFNIMLNAIEAMPNGGKLFVDASVIPKKIKSTVAHNKIIEITIRDSGSGITEENLKHIFDPFFTNKDFGTGLGLAIVQSIIENHHGKISVKSKIGEGTAVIIKIPAVNPN